MSQRQRSLKQAYLAMFAFLDQSQKTLGSDDLAALLGEMSLLPDGSPADPGYWREWEEAVDRSQKQPKLADLVLVKP